MEGGASKLESLISNDGSNKEDMNQTVKKKQAESDNIILKKSFQPIANTTQMGDEEVQKKARKVNLEPIRKVAADYHQINLRSIVTMDQEPMHMMQAL